MDGQLWRELYRRIRRCARRLPKPRRRFVYSDAQIAAMFFWAAWFEKPQSWACRRSSYNGLFRPRRLPSVSEFNKRIRSWRFARLMRLLEVDSRGETDGLRRLILDARPLVVGGCSKDPDAKAGRVCGGFGRGYRLHTLTAEGGVTFAWEVTSLREAESEVARRLLTQAPAGALVVADGNYDRGPLYQIAAERGVVFLARPRRNAGCGHRPQNPHRLAAIRQWNLNPTYYARLRSEIERIFGQQTSVAGGLLPLPPWVRRLDRVRRWVQAKLILHHLRLSLRNQPNDAAA